jgi:N-acetylneuraminic acid mutarotase
MVKRNIYIIRLSVLFLIASFSTNAQWSPISPVPAGIIGNDAAVSFAINGKGYVVSGSGTDQMYAYDTLTGSWSSLGAVPAGMGHAFAMSFVLNGKGYVIGGDIAGTPVNAVWEFDPASMATPWTQKNDFTPGARNGGFGFAINNAGYVGAGNDNVYLYNDIWKYNQALDSWTQLPVSIPINGLIFPSSFVIGNEGYILTGGTNPSGVNEVTNMWSLNGLNDSLTPRASFTGAARQAAFAFSNNNYGYLGGGQANYVTNYIDMWRYDPINNFWSQSSNSPMLGNSWASTFVIGNIAYAGYGAKLVASGLNGNLNFYKFQLTATAVNESKTKDQISAYPNPARDYIYINRSVNKSAIFSICDIEGRVYKNENISDGHKLFTGDLSPGTYLMKIKDGDEINTIKFIKN